MILKSLLHIVYRNIVFRKRRTAFLLLGTCVVMSIMTFIISSTHIMISYFEEEKKAVYGEYDAIINKADRNQIIEALGNEIEIFGSIKTYGNYIITRNDNLAIKGTIGYFDEDMISMAHIRMLEGNMPTGADEIAVEQSIYVRLKDKSDVVDKIGVELNINDAVSQTEYKVVGVYRDISNVWPIDQNQYKLPSIITNNSAELSDIAYILKFKKESDVDYCLKKLSSIQNEGIHNNTIQYDPDEKNTKIRTSIINMAVVLIALMFISMFICFLQANRAVISVRSQQYRIIRSIGGSNKNIALLSIIESICLYLICVPISLITGYIISYFVIIFGASTLNAHVPFFISGITAIFILITGFIFTVISWFFSVSKLKNKKPQKTRMGSRVGNLIRFAIIGKPIGIHIAAFGATIACACFLILPYFTRSFLSSFYFLKYDEYQQGEYFINRPGDSYISYVFIPDNLSIGIDYEEIQNIKRISEVESVTYYNQMDRVKLKIEDDTLNNNNAIKKSKLEESRIGKKVGLSKINEEKEKYGYITNNKTDDIALCTLSGVDISKLSSLKDKLSDGYMSLDKLESGNGVYIIDVSEISGDESIFKPGDSVNLSQTTYGESADYYDKILRHDFSVEILGTITISQEEMKEYFSNAYADVHTDGVGIRFLCTTQLFINKKLPSVIDDVVITLKDPYDYDEVQAYVDNLAVLMPELDILSKPIASQLRQGLVTIITALSLFISLAIFTIGMLSLGFAFYSNIISRGKEHGIIKAIGVSRKRLASVYMKYGAANGLCYSLICTAIAISFYSFMITSDSGMIQFFFAYASSSGLWYRSFLCIFLQTLITSLVGALLYRKNDSSINESIRYE